MPNPSEEVIPLRALFRSLSKMAQDDLWSSACAQQSSNSWILCSAIFECMPAFPGKLMATDPTTGPSLNVRGKCDAGADLAVEIGCRRQHHPWIHCLNPGRPLG